MKYITLYYLHRLLMVQDIRPSYRDCHEIISIVDIIKHSNASIFLLWSGGAYLWSREYHMFYHSRAERENSDAVYIAL